MGEFSFWHNCVINGNYNQFSMFGLQGNCTVQSTTVYKVVRSNLLSAQQNSTESKFKMACFNAIEKERYVNRIRGDYCFTNKYLICI